jgi:Predicted 3'-5' exonuclease related to the exonuclease domain of PolB
LISCSHWLPDGSVVAFVGKRGRDEPGRQGTLQHVPTVTRLECRLTACPRRGFMPAPTSTGTIADYCETDVVGTYQLWLRYELFRGTLSQVAFEASERSLANFVNVCAEVGKPDNPEATAHSMITPATQADAKRPKAR